MAENVAPDNLLMVLSELQMGLHHCYLGLASFDLDHSADQSVGLSPRFRDDLRKLVDELVVFLTIAPVANANADVL